MKRCLVISFFSFLTLALLLAVGLFFFRQEKPGELLFLCGAGMKAPALAVVKEFEAQTGIRVHTRFDGSSILQEFILTFRAGDVFLPGDVGTLRLLEERRLVTDSGFLAWHKVAILIPPRMQATITSVDDLARPGIRIALSNPRLASLGKLVMRRIIDPHPNGAAILDNIKIYGSSSQEILQMYKQGGIDAIIEWDALAGSRQGKDLVVVPLKDPYRIVEPIHAGLLATTDHPDAARRFFTFLLGRGKEIFRQYGYDINESLN